MVCRPTKKPAGRARFVVPGRHRGLLVDGNIDLYERPFAHNRDGSISTVRSASYDIEEGAVLIPTVVGHGNNGRVLCSTDRCNAAFDHYRATGKHLGIFTNWRLADAYSDKLHLQQARIYCLTGKA